MFIYAENSTNGQRFYILSHQKFVKTVQQSNSKYFWIMCKQFFYFVIFKKFDFDPDPEMDPEPDPELSEKSDPEPDPEIIISAPTHWTKEITLSWVKMVCQWDQAHSFLKKSILKVPKHENFGIGFFWLEKSFQV